MMPNIHFEDELQNPGTTTLESLKEENEFYKIEHQMYYEPQILGKRLEECEQKYDEERYKCSQLRKEIEELKYYIKSKEKTKSQFDNIFKTDQGLLDALKYQNIQLRDINKQLTSSKEELAASIQKTQTKYSDCMKEMKLLKKKNAELTKENDKHKNEKLNWEHEKALHVNVVNQLKSQIGMRKKENDELKAIIVKYKQQEIEHSQELHKVDIIHKKLETDIKIKTQRCKNNDTVVKTLKNKKKDLEGKLKKVNHEVTQAFLENPSLKLQITLLKKRLDNCEFKFTDKLEKLKKYNSLLKKILRGARVKNYDLKRANNDLTEKYELLAKEKVKYIYTGEDIGELRETIKKLKKENLEWEKKFHNSELPIVVVGRRCVNDDDSDEEDTYCDCKVTKKLIENKECENKMFVQHQYTERLKRELAKYKKYLEECNDKVTFYQKDYIAKNEEVKEIQNRLKEKDLEIFQHTMKIHNLQESIKFTEIRKAITVEDNLLVHKQYNIVNLHVKESMEELQQRKRECVKNAQTIKENEKEIAQLKNEKILMEKQIWELNEKLNKPICKRKQLELVEKKINLSSEKVQKKLLMVEKELNNAKLQIVKSKKDMEEIKRRCEFDKKIAANERFNSQEEIRKLKFANRDLKHKLSIVDKLEKENMDLKFKVAKDQETVMKSKMKVKELLDKKERIFNTQRLLEVVDERAKVMRKAYERAKKRCTPVKTKNLLKKRVCPAS